MSPDDSVRSHHPILWTATMLVAAFIGAAAVVLAAFVAKWDFGGIDSSQQKKLEARQSEIASLQRQLEERDALIQSFRSSSGTNRIQELEELLRRERSRANDTTKLLEASRKEIEQLMAAAKEAVEFTSPASSNSRFQEFPQFRVEVASLRRLSGGRIEVVLKYMNKTTRDFILSIPTWCYQTQLMSDEAGNDYRCDNFVGLGYYYGPKVEFSGLTLPAGRSATASIRFNPPRQMAAQGSKFSFNGQHLLLSPVVVGSPKVEATYTVSILNIEPR